MIGKLTIRADATPTIGTGHVMRMIALGQAWQELGGEVTFVGDIALLKDRLDSFAFSSIQMKYDTTNDEIDQLIAVTNHKDWIVLDGYHFASDYQAMVRTAGRRTLVVDDINDRKSYDADCLLNQNVDAYNYSYSINQDAELLLGTRFAMLRREFLTPPAPVKTINKTAKRILVTLGGADVANFTGTILKAISLAGTPFLKVRVISGPGNPRLPELQKTIEDLPLSCELLTNVKHMAPLMEWADVAVSTASSTCWELCRFGVPMLLVQVAENQKGIADKMAKLGIAYTTALTAPPEQIADTIKKLCTNRRIRQEMSTKGHELIDGKGAKRVASHIITSDITIRKAQKADSDVLLEWRNALSVRQHCFNSALVSHADHEQWFSQKLLDENCLLFIAVDRHDTPLGQIRFDRKKNLAFIGISVSPSIAGLGIGTKIVRQACERLKSLWTDVTPVAEVKKSNWASERMFQKAGFSLSDETEKEHKTYTLKQ